MSRELPEDFWDYPLVEVAMALWQACSGSGPEMDESADAYRWLRTRLSLWSESKYVPVEEPLRRFVSAVVDYYENDRKQLDEECPNPKATLASAGYGELHKLRRDLAEAQSGLAKAKEIVQLLLNASRSLLAIRYDHKAARGNMKSACRSAENLIHYWDSVEFDKKAKTK